MKIIRQSTLGFTRTDLVTTLGLAAILLTLFGRSVTQTRAGQEGVTCLGNKRQLMLALHLYTVENADFLPPMMDLSSGVPGQNWLFHTAHIAPDGTNHMKLIDSNSSMLAPYLDGNYGVFKCPADTSTIPTGTGPRPRVRSISMSHSVGTNPMSVGAKTATDGAWLDGNHGHLANRQYRTYARLADIVNPRPSQLFVFLDEAPESINDAAFGNQGPLPSGTGYRWIDWPATYHNRSAGFAFADGHAEIKMWVGSGTLLSPPTIAGGAMNDLHWIATHTTAFVSEQP